MAARFPRFPSCRFFLTRASRRTLTPSCRWYASSHAASRSPSGDDEDSILLRHDCDETGITKLTLNRPAKLNALSSPLIAALQNSLDDIAQDSSVRVVILAAASSNQEEGQRPPCFSAGHDLQELVDSSQGKDAGTSSLHHRRLFDQCSRMMISLHSMPQPVVASVNGMAAAAGCQLVATCDLAVASTTARFAVSGIKTVGLFCSTPAVALSRCIGRKRAMHMLLTGDAISAETALDYGLVNQVVPPDELEVATMSLAQSIAAKPAASVALGKDMFYQQLTMDDLTQAYAFASERMACNLDTDDAREGVDAFLEKRKPQWNRR